MVFCGNTCSDYYRCLRYCDAYDCTRTNRLDADYFTFLCLAKCEFQSILYNLVEGIKNV